MTLGMPLFLIAAGAHINWATVQNDLKTGLTDQRSASIHPPLQKILWRHDAWLQQPAFQRLVPSDQYQVCPAGG